MATLRRFSIWYDACEATRLYTFKTRGVCCTPTLCYCSHCVHCRSIVPSSLAVLLCVVLWMANLAVLDYMLWVV